MVVLKSYEPMKNHLSFACGGYAKFFCEVKNINELIEAIKLAKKLRRKFFVLGKGTNLLCPDEGYNGVVISTRKMQNISLTKYNEKVFVEADAGVDLFKINKLLAELGISGLEWSYGIPGTLGGAIFMNAGAYGHEIFEFVSYVDIYYRGKIKRLKKEKINFSYRNGGLNGKTILSAGLMLTSNKFEAVKEKQLSFMKKRIETQPLNYPNAGSIFKRNEKIIPAQIIDKLGLKGVIIGGAKVSEKHAGFIVNIGNATTKNILDLIELIQKKVYDATKIKLEPEIKIMK